jgi:hypothetical protein
MSTKRHHAEWLSLVEVSGPFLTMPVLEKVFPQGLDAHDPDHFAVLRAAYEEWDENQTCPRPQAAIHAAWIKFVLQQTLGLLDEVLAEGQGIPQTIKATVAEHGETLRPDFVVHNPDGVADAGKARLLIQIYPFDQNLDKPIAGKHWKASPATRMMELLHCTEVRLGLVTNGEHWMLVDAPRGDTTGFASWYGSLWLEEKITLQAFRSLLGVRRFFNVPDDETLEAMLKESANYQNEVTDQLGLQVRRAVEVLIQSLDRADQDHGRSLLADVPETVLYEAALTVMMRLVFLFCAEERGLLLLGDEFYNLSYAVSTLVAQLQEAADQHGEEVLERRLDAWVRLLSTFRAVYGGVQHERMKLPAYSGNLFNPDRFMFLEGRKPDTSWRNTPANPLPVNNRTVLHLLRSLQYLEMQGEAQRLSFRALDIEQIGHVYEGLLDHTAKRATEPVLGLVGAKGKQSEIPLAELEMRIGASAPAESDDLIEFLNEKTGKSESSLRNALETKVDGDDAGQLRTACGNADALFKRVLPFANVIRTDSFGKPVVIRKGSVYVTEGTDRRSSGTHYTPKSLTEPIVQYTLEPLVFDGPTQGKPKEEWQLRSARELLDLKICDMACGSAAFLVQTCRLLSELLAKAWDLAEAEHPGVPGITPEGTASTGAPGEALIPKDANERLVYARRLVAQRCLYGVDKNPLAVEMAKLSLWLLTLAKDKPFTFLDHAIRCGDSLVGVTNLRQIEVFNLACEGDGYPLILDFLKQRIKRAIELRRKLEEMPVKSVEDVQTQEAMFAECQALMDRAKVAADWLVAAEFQGGSESDREALRVAAAIQVAGHFDNPDFATFEREARKRLNGQPTFHWPLEFPEVLVERGGFNALVCNPPWMGGKKIRGNLGAQYRAYLVSHLASGARGHADLCAYFLLRASQVTTSPGGIGIVATSAVAEGDSREVGLDQLVSTDKKITRANTSRPWPGTAGVTFTPLWLWKGAWGGGFILDDQFVKGITSLLSQVGNVEGKPFRLASNQAKSFIGSYVLGTGFILTPEEAHELITRNPKNANVLFPYLTGQDLNSSPTHAPSRWVINFADWPLDQRCAPNGYIGPLASDYPDCLRIISERVKPERTRTRKDGSFVLRQPLPKKWWIYADKRPALYSAIGKVRWALGVARAATKYVAFAVLSGRMIFSDAITIVVDDSFDAFAALNSSFHEVWARQYASTNLLLLRYTPSDCFETFPMPPTSVKVAQVGSDYEQWRRHVMESRQLGLTQTYNLFHESEETDEDIQKLRELHIEMDKAVATAHGWTDLDLGHDFHETKQGRRFTICEAARREVLGRLLKLNHDRYAEEVAKGLHDKKGKVKVSDSGKGRRSTSTQPAGENLFGSEESEDYDPGGEAAREEGTQTEKGAQHENRRRCRGTPAQGDERPISIDEVDTDEIMAAFRQSARGQGWKGRDDLLKDVSLTLGYQRLGPKIEEALRGHLRAAIRRKIIVSDGDLVRLGTATMDQYDHDDLRATLCSVMRAGRRYEREEVIHAVPRSLGFARVTDTVRQSLKSAINSAIRQGILGYEGSVIWREQ